MIQYQGIFLDEESIKKLIESQGVKLPKNPNNMHCTFKFQPTDTEIQNFSKLLGKKVTLKVIGYGCNGKNSGFQIELLPEQENVYTNSQCVEEKGIVKVKKKVPHITVSLSDDGKAVDTAFLEFLPIKPFDVTGYAGFFKKENGKGEVIYISPTINVTEHKNDDGNVK